MVSILQVIFFMLLIVYGIGSLLVEEKQQKIQYVIIVIISLIAMLITFNVQI